MQHDGVTRNGNSVPQGNSLMRNHLELVRTMAGRVGRGGWRAVRTHKSGATVGRQVGRSSRELARIIGGVAILPAPLFISI